jgi:recombination protein RecA
MDKKLIERFGEQTFITAADLVATEELISASPRLDIILGGGIPGGSFVNIMGDPKVGKTITALCIARNAQKLGRSVIFYDIEGRIKPRDMQGIRGLDLSKVKIVRSYRDRKTGKTRIHTAEEYLQLAEWAVHNVPGAVLIFDSVSQLAAEKEINADMGDQLRAPGPVLMAQFCRKVSNVVPVNDIVIISILHLICNTSGFGASKVPSGGRKIQYACDIGLNARRFTYKRPGSKDTETAKPPYGQEVLWQTTSTAVCAPGQQITSMIRYGVGIDETIETLQLAVDCNFIKKSGSWFTIEGKRVQGEEKACNYLNDNEDILNQLKTKVREMLF